MTTIIAESCAPPRRSQPGKGRLAVGLRALRDRDELRGSAQPERLAQEAMATIQGGYLLSTTKREVGPMRAALSAALERLQSFAVLTP